MDAASRSRARLVAVTALIVFAILVAQVLGDLAAFLGWLAADSSPRGVRDTPGSMVGASMRLRTLQPSPLYDADYWTLHDLGGPADDTKINDGVLTVKSFDVNAIGAGATVFFGPAAAAGKEKWGAASWSQQNVNAWDASKVNNGDRADRAFHVVDAPAAATWVMLDTITGRAFENISVHVADGDPAAEAIWDVEASNDAKTWTVARAGLAVGGGRDDGWHQAQWYGGIGTFRYWRIILRTPAAASVGSNYSEIQFYNPRERFNFGKVVVTSAGTGHNATWDVQYSDDFWGGWTTAYAGFQTGAAVTESCEWVPPGPHLFWRLLKTNAATPGPDYYEVQWWAPIGSSRVGATRGDEAARRLTPEQRAKAHEMVGNRKAKSERP